MPSYSYDDPVMVSFRQRQQAALRTLRQNGPMPLGEFRKAVEALADEHGTTSISMWVAGSDLIHSDPLVHYDSTTDTVTA